MSETWLRNYENDERDLVNNELFVITKFVKTLKQENERKSKKHGYIIKQWMKVVCKIKKGKELI